MNESSLAGQRVLITGGASGIGLALANELAARISGDGAELVLLGRSGVALEAAVTALGARYRKVAVRGVVLDLAERPLALSSLAGVPDLDVLVHCAGAYLSDALLDVDAQQLEELFRINVSGAHELTRSVADGLVRRAGQIVFMGSSVVTQPVRSQPGAYTVTKRAAAAMADAWRDSMNPEGVRVLTVHPGRTATPMQESIAQALQKTWHPERLLQPEDIAHAVVAALELPASAELTELSIRPFLKS